LHKKILSKLVFMIIDFFETIISGIFILFFLGILIMTLLIQVIDLKKKKVSIYGYERSRFWAWLQVIFSVIFLVFVILNLDDLFRSMFN